MSLNTCQFCYQYYDSKHDFDGISYPSQCCQRCKMEIWAAMSKPDYRHVIREAAEYFANGGKVH